MSNFGQITHARVLIADSLDCSNVIHICSSLIGVIFVRFLKLKKKVTVITVWIGIVGHIKLIVAVIVLIMIKKTLRN